MDYVKLALAVGFDDAKLLKVSDLVVVPEFRKLCEKNVCGNYNVAAGCPPKCGTVNEMVAKMNRYKRALVLKTKKLCKDYYDRREQESIQEKQNKLTEVLFDLMKSDGVEDILFMSAGPWGENSCLSAYCIHAQKMAEKAEMTCWKNDGYARYFSLLLY